MKTVYAVLAIPGFLLPLSQLFRGIHPATFLTQLFANPVSSMFALDLIVSCIVFWAFVYAESRRVGVRHAWLYVAFTLLVGLSFALPMFMLARERVVAAS